MISPASSKRAISAEADRVPRRVTRSRAHKAGRPKIGGDAHPPEAPGQKTGAFEVGVPIGDQRQQRLQCAIHQGGVDQIAIERLVDDDESRCATASSLPNSSMRVTVRNCAPVIEPELGGEAIERLPRRLRLEWACAR